jgi:plasmid stabilization system protein ParE
MAKRVIWSEIAKNQRREILEYWAQRNANKTYSKKLSNEFRTTINYIKEYNYLGRATGIDTIRVTVCGYYLIFYCIDEEVIEILTIWDNRRNPSELKKHLKN